MINKINREHYESKLAIFINNVFNNNLEKDKLDEIVSNSIICSNLEGDKEDFLSLTNKDIFSYSVQGGNAIISDEYSLVTLWISKVYINLFIKYKKSFEFIMAYMPIKEMTYLYTSYHDGNMEAIEKLFIRRSNETPLLKILIKRNDLSLNQLSAKTGINYNTLDKYSRNNSYLSSASYENIYKISRVLHVKENIFINNLIVSITEEAVNKENNFLMDQIILYTLMYNDVTLAKVNYEHDSNENVFLSKKDKLFIAYPENQNDLERLLKNKFDVEENKENSVAFFITWKLAEKPGFTVENLAKVYIVSAEQMFIFEKNKTNAMERKKYDGLVNNNI